MKAKNTITLLTTLLSLVVAGDKNFEYKVAQATQRYAATTEMMLSEFKKRYVDDPNSFYKACSGNGEYPMSNAIVGRCAEGISAFLHGEAPETIFFALDEELKEIAAVGRRVRSQLEREIRL